MAAVLNHFGIVSLSELKSFLVLQNLSRKKKPLFGAGTRFRSAYRKIPGTSHFALKILLIPFRNMWKVCEWKAGKEWLKLPYYKESSRERLGLQGVE